MTDLSKKELINIIDLEFILRPFEPGGPVVSGQSQSLNISCHVRLDNGLLKEKGLDYIRQLCYGIKDNIAFQYQNGLIE